jgi:hypothetical protein
MFTYDQPTTVVAQFDWDPGTDMHRGTFVVVNPPEGVTVQEVDAALSQIEPEVPVADRVNEDDDWDLAGMRIYLAREVERLLPGATVDVARCTFLGQ